MAAMHNTKSFPLLVLLAWAVVVIPAAWGFSYTLQNAMKIFTAPASQTASPPAATHPQ